MDLLDESIQCVVTSPPYWGLRKYDGQQDSGGFVYGLEKTPELYVEHTVLFLREIRRVLKDDGCVFWNVGDSYAGGGPHHGDKNLGKSGTNRGSISGIDRFPVGLKPKDLALIPFRVALAAQMDGWWVRSDIIWAKPNPMPESVRDRPTSSHEHIFMFTKSKDYYWDQDAVREPSVSDHPSGNGFKREARVTYQNQDGSARGRDEQWVDVGGARNIRDVWTIATQPSGFKHYAAFPLEIPTRCIKASTREGDTVLDPFCGTGRTLEAALKLGRNAVGYDLSERYCEMARQRCNETQVEMMEGGTRDGNRDS